MSEIINEIERIDQNLAKENIKGVDVVWYNVRQAPFRIYGLMRTEDDARFCRLPDSVAKNPAINGGVRALYTNTAGGRARFSTDSPYLLLRCQYNLRAQFTHMPATGIRGFDLFLDGEKSSDYMLTFTPDYAATDGYTVKGRNLRLPRGMHSFTLNFPLYNNVDEVYIGVAPDARVEAGKEYHYQKPAVFYGSSITQGGCASRPGNSYPALISSWLDMDYVNLGFSGSGLAEEEMMEYIASLDMGMFIYDYDHNAPNAEYLEKTHERGFRIIRKKHPDLPVILVSKPDWRPDATSRTARRRDVIFKTYLKAFAEGDKNVAVVDGRSFFAMRERHACTVDGCHPNDLGMFQMAQGICDAMEYFLKELR